jgi:Na+-translocating ferredoxin:NAD+ oxidoreductase RNF subunit RnfB
MNIYIIAISILTLALTGILSAIILFFVSGKFKVFEDPVIKKLEAALPSSNCGGCGYPSCHAFAIACENAETLEKLFCTVGGLETMENVAGIIGKSAGSLVPTVAVVRCGGACDLRKQINQYDGAKSCVISHNLYGGETGCTWGCLGLGDCELSCEFDAIHINPYTRLPEVNEEKCTSCQACVKACPKSILELRRKGIKSRRIYVNCINKDQGEAILESCPVACIACEKCLNVCAYEAITLTNNLAFIDSDKCTLCRKCVEVCPTNAIVEVNFPTKRVMAKNVIEPLISH